MICAADGLTPQRDRLRPISTTPYQHTKDRLFFYASNMLSSTLVSIVGKRTDNRLERTDHPPGELTDLGRTVLEGQE
jgi:hypothetical protein